MVNVMQKLTVILNNSCFDQRLVITDNTFDQTDIDTINLWLTGKIGSELLNPFTVDDLDNVINIGRIYWYDSAYLVDVYWSDAE